MCSPYKEVEFFVGGGLKVATDIFGRWVALLRQDVTFLSCEVATNLGPIYTKAIHCVAFTHALYDMLTYIALK